MKPPAADPGLRDRPALEVPPHTPLKPPIFLQQNGVWGRSSARNHLVATMPIRVGAHPAARSPRLPDPRRSGHKRPDVSRKPSGPIAELREAAAPFGLACLSGCYPAQLLGRDTHAELDAMRRHLDLLRAVGGDVLVFADTSSAVHLDVRRPLSSRPVLKPEAWPAFGARLTWLANAVAVKGVSLAYRHHMGTIVQSRDDIARLMDVTGPSVKLLLDTAHATWAGADPAELARAYAPRVVHIHASDLCARTLRRATDEDWSFPRAVLEGVFTVPGTGIVDHASVFAALPRYQGWIVIEAAHDPARANALDHAEMGYRHLHRVLAEAGLVPASPPA